MTAPTAPHSSAIPKARLQATMADLDPLFSRSMIPFDDTANRPEWASGATRQTTDLPPGATEAWNGPTSAINVKARSVPFSVDPAIPYRLSFWAKASVAGSRMFLELRHSSLDHSVLSGTIGSLNDTYLIGRLDVPAEWTYFESIIRIKPGVTRTFIGSVYYNHTSGTVTNAVQSLADLKLEPAYVRESDPRLSDSRTPVAHKHPPADLSILVGSTVPSATTYYRGDGQWATPTNTTYALMTQAIADAGTSLTANSINAAVLKAAILKHTATKVEQSALTEFRNALLASTKRFNVKDYGAVGDGVADDTAAINLALAAAEASSGGTVYFPPGNYRITAPIGKTTGQYANIVFKCDAQGSARIFAATNFTPLIGAWYRCNIKFIEFDAALKGSPAVNIHMAETVMSECVLNGWTEFGAKLNDGTYGDIGLLNRFERNHVVQHTGVGVFQTYRWVDSWIDRNNIGSTGPNLSLEGGPLRVTGNHLNGAPEVNILLRGNKRIEITSNICEGARKEAIVYEMPPWLTEDDAQVIIGFNNISNGGKGSPGTYQAVRLQGVAGTAGLSGFTFYGNIVACEDAGSGWTHVLGLHNTKQVSAGMNVWEKGYTVAPILLTNGSPAPRSVGNTSGNIIPVGDLATTGTPSASTFLRGDGKWMAPVELVSSFPASPTPGVLYLKAE